MKWIYWIKCELFGIHTPTGFAGWNGRHQLSTCKACYAKIEKYPNGKWYKV